MGMFDYVDISIKCPECLEWVSGFQSKDGPCRLLTIPLERVDSLHAKCKNCGKWLEFYRRYPEGSEVLPGFDIVER